MTYADLINSTQAARAAAGERYTKHYRRAMNQFLRLAELSPRQECSDRYLNEGYFQFLRAKAEEEGALTDTTGAPWVSRMKHILRTFHRLQIHNEKATFSELLKKGLDQSGLSKRELAVRSGCPEPNINNWYHGKNLGAGSRRYIGKIDDILKLEGRLLASVDSMALRPSSKAALTDEEKERCKRGDGTLREIVRYLVRERKKTFKEVTAHCRSATRNELRRLKPRTHKNHSYGWRLTEEDRPAFEKMDSDLGAEGLIIKKFYSELAAQTPTGEQLKFSFKDWPERLKKEWKAFVEYKTTNPLGLERTADGRWTSFKTAEGNTVSATEKGTLTKFEYLFGWALRSGAIARVEDLRLAHVIVPEFVIGHLEERSERTGRALNKSDKNIVGTFRSYFYGGDDKKNPGLGYFANDQIGALFASDPFFESRLPLSYEAYAPGGYRISLAPVSIPKDDLRSRWQAYLAQSSKALGRYMAQITAPSGNFAEAVEDILANKDYDITAWINRGFLKLLHETPGRSSAPVAWAIHVRNTVMFLFMITRGFRRSTMLRLELSHVPFDPKTEKYYFIIPETLFKQRGKGGSKGGVHSEVDAVFDEMDTPLPTVLPPHTTGLLTTYLEEARPRLGIKSNSFFGLKTATIVGRTIESTAHRALGRHINAHAFRYLIATWAKRKGISVEDTAAILCHMPASTRRIYDMTNAQDVGVRTNAAVRKLYS